MQNPFLFNLIRNDIEKYEDLQIAGIYKINCKNNKNEEIVDAGMIKRKSEERLKLHICGLKYNNNQEKTE